MNKEDIVNEIKTIINDAQNKIIDIIKKEKISYFPYYTIDQLRDMRQHYYWITEPHTKFFNYFVYKNTHDKEFLLSTIKTCMSEDSLACHILTTEDKEAFIRDFDNNAQESLDKHKRTNKLYKQIEAAKKA